jgi:hypothetical protein
MRAPQYGHNRGKRRGSNPYSRPIGVPLPKALRVVPATLGQPTSKPGKGLQGHAAVPCITVPASKVTSVTIHTFLKSAKGGPWALVKHKGQVCTKPVVKEADRVLAMPLPNERPKSRNDNRSYVWAKGHMASSVKSRWRAALKPLAKRQAVVKKIGL